MKLIHSQTDILNNFQPYLLDNRTPNKLLLKSSHPNKIGILENSKNFLWKNFDQNIRWLPALLTQSKVTHALLQSTKMENPANAEKVYQGTKPAEISILFG